MATNKETFQEEGTSPYTHQLYRTMRESQDLTIGGAAILIDETQTFIEQFNALVKQVSSVHLICDENTFRHCLPLIPFVQAHIKDPIVISAGEEHKNLDTCEHVWQSLIAQSADRKSLVLNLGGGVVTDLGGFCASTYMRGIRFIHIPTTLMGMCDAALGGKQGIDFQQLKNYIGLIAQPECIWINSQFLQTLPQRHLRNGMAEVVKHALIGNVALFEFLQNAHLDDIDWLSLLRQSVEVKISFVEEDIYEHGMRAALNFGHTFGHAIESHFLSRSPLLHGESVALGMIAETWLSHLVLGTPDRNACHAISALINQWIPVEVSEPVTIDELMPFLERDKKQQAGEVRFSLIREIGDPVIHQVVSPEMIRELLLDAETARNLPWLRP